MRSRVTLAAAACTATLLLASPVQATELDTEGAAELFTEAVAVAAPEVFEDLSGPESAVEAANAEVTLGEFSVELPVDEPAPVDTLADGTPVYEDDAVTLAPIEKSDGSVQVTFVLQDSSAPGTFDFPIEGVPDGSLTIQEDGSVVSLDAQGVLVLGVAEPWAKDAAGASVPTHYEVRGSTLVQVVDHVGGEFQYPIVADPWLGIDLFSRVWTDTYSGQLRVNARKSAWGQAMHTPTLAGQAIFLNAGWSEVKSKAPRVTEKTTLHQQYQCHVAGGYGNLAGDWNLEKFRPTRTVHWSYGVAIHRCNWTTATRY